MAELERARAVKEVELTGRVVNGEIIFDTPAPLLVEPNTLYIGDTKVTLKLRAARSENLRRHAPAYAAIGVIAGDMWLRYFSQRQLGRATVKIAPS